MTMIGTTGYYSIVQYCPDPMRKEVANVGVVLLCPELEFLAVRMTEDEHRIVGVFPKLRYDPQQLATELRFIERRLSVDREHFKTADALQRFAQTRASAMRLTTPLPIRVEEPNAALDRLFERLVSDRDGRTCNEGRQEAADIFAANKLSIRRGENGTPAAEQAPVAARDRT